MKRLFCFAELAVVLLLVCECSSLDDEVEPYKIPLLMKTLRLRPFSGNNLEYIPEAQLRQLRLRSSRQIIESDDADDSQEANPRISGWDFVQTNENRPKVYRHRILPHPIPRLDKMRRHKFPLKECNDNHRQHVKLCFENYFKDFGVEVSDDKLPPISEVRAIFEKDPGFESRRQKNEDFKNCYKHTPASCYESRNLAPILADPEDSDEYAAFFTSNEYSSKDATTRRLVLCFLDHLEPFESIAETDDEEDKVSKCAAANLKIQRARYDFRTFCARKITAKIDQWLTVFVKRQSIGQFCPQLIANRKSLPF